MNLEVIMTNSSGCIPIVFAVNNDYVKQLTVTVISILKNSSIENNINIKNHKFYDLFAVNSLLHLIQYTIIPNFSFISPFLIEFEFFLVNKLLFIALSTISKT